MMAIIYTNKGEEILVDDDDYGWLNQFTWNISHYGYARTGVGPRNDRVYAYMHKLILRVPAVARVDHEDRNKLNNTRDNLRRANARKNALNTGLRSDNKTGFKGVKSRQTQSGIRYDARAKINGVGKHLGTFECPVEAAKAYDNFITEIEPEFSLTNKGLGLYV